MRNDAALRWADARKRMRTQVDAVLWQDVGVHSPDREKYVDWILDRIFKPEYLGVFGKEWTVWRQDDVGNHFVVETGLSYERAQEVALEFERRGHKQFYWCTPAKSEAETA